MPENQTENILHAPIQTPGENSLMSGIIFFMLCVILVYSGIAFGAVDVASLGLLSIFTGFIVICWLIEAWRKGEFSFDPNLLQIPLLGLILIGLIQLLPFRTGADISADLLSIPPTGSLSLAPFETRLAIIKFLVYFIFFAASLAFINNRERLRKMVLVVIIFGSLMAFYGILQRLGSPEEIYGYRRIGQAIPFASFINQHHFAAFMEMTVGLTLALLFGKSTKNDKRYLLIIAAVLMGIAIIFTGSRGGLLSLLGVLGFVIGTNLLIKPGAAANEASEKKATNLRRSLILLGGGLVLILTLFTLVILLGGDDSLLRGVGFYSTDAEDFSNGRLHFWSIAWQNFLNYPILGSGLDSYGIIFSQYDTWSGVFRVEHAHNDYLQILSDGGLVGFACIVAFIYLLFRKGLKTIGNTENGFRRSVAIGSLAGCFGIVIHSFVDFPLRTPSNGFFFLILASLATVSIHYPKALRRKNTRRD